MKDHTPPRFPGETSRPRSLEDMLERMSYFRSEAAMEAVRNFSVRPEDVFVATYSKSGTTWMQHVVHQLRTGGDTGFGEVSGVVPWIESAVDMGIDPEAEQQGNFRAFKSHLMYRDLPKGGRYITVFRNPEGVLPSFYRFFEGWMFETGCISLEEFAEGFYFPGSEAGRHWHHFCDWWPKRNAPDTLALSYEDMVAVPDKVPALVAKFLNIDVDDSTLKTIIYNCSREYMVVNNQQFNDHLMRKKQDPLLGIPPGGDASKVTDGRQGVRVSDDLKQQMQAIWKELLTPVLGFESYTEFRQALPNPLGVDRPS